MRRTLLSVIGFLLVATTTYVVMWVGASLLRGEAGEGGVAGGASGQQVVEVLAMDRLRLGSGTEVRLAALRVPAPGQPYAEEGKQATRALTMEQTIRIVGPPEAAYVYLPGGELLQERLISGGYARVAEDAPEDETIALLRGAEAQARDANLGLWTGISPLRLTGSTATPLPAVEPAACTPALLPGKTFGAAEAADHIGEEANVVFLPNRTEERSGSLLVLAGPTDDLFGIVIPPTVASTIEQPGMVFLNRCIAVTGRIERDILGPGPRITIRTLDDVIIIR